GGGLICSPAQAGAQECRRRCSAAPWTPAFAGAQEGGQPMKLAIAFATGVLAMTSPADAAPPRPAVEHFGKPTLNGQPLPFSEAVRVGDILYLSGQLGRGSDGKLPDGIEAQTRQTLDNIG